MTLTGSGSAATATDASGNYTFTGLASGSYTVTPSLAGGYAFSPTSKAVTVNGGNQTGINFTETGAYSISGTVSGDVQSGVTMTLTGSGSGTTTTNGSGYYSFTGLPNGSYTVTPSLGGGYVFSPASAPVTITNGNQTSINFTATAVPTYSISGTVSGDVQSGVTMTLTGSGSGATTTNGSGYYSFSGLSNGSYTVTPSLGSGYVFSPTSAPVTITNGNQTSINFTATATPNGTYNISGTVSYSGAKSGWIYINVFDDYGDQTNYGTAIYSKGSFTIRGVEPGTYYLTATMDIIGFGLPNASDPSGNSAGVTVTSSNVCPGNIGTGDGYPG